MIKVYTTQTCHFCKDVKNLLDSNNVEYELLDVGTDAAARTEMVELTGQMGVPVTRINDDVIIGYDEAKLRELLSL